MGPGLRREVLENLPDEGDILVVTSAGGRCREPVATLLDRMPSERLVVIDDVESNPTLVRLEEQIGRMAAKDVRLVVAIGGGSVLDSAKVITVGMTDSGFDLRCHLKGDAPLPGARRARLVCLPTTAGTGSEVTPFATVWDTEDKRKLSLAGSTVFPDMAILDPELTLTVPVDTTLMTGLDAITQAFEATWSRRRNGISTAAAFRSVRLGLAALPKLAENPGDLHLRTTMLECSLLAGLAISNSRTALCHSISYPLTMRLGIPHGLACGFVLPEVLAYNREENPSLAELLAIETGFRSSAELETFLEKFLTDIGIGRLLREYDLSVAGVEVCVPEMLTPGRADNNLRDTSVDDVRSLVAAAIRHRQV